VQSRFAWNAVMMRGHRREHIRTKYGFFRCAL
jgi:hypothetical protein